MFEKALSGNRRYWSWIGLLLVVIGAGAVSYIMQLTYGLGITGMSRNVSWGMYIANFTFFVGVAASAVMVVLPYYLHNVKDFARITALGEFLAVSAVIVAVLFVVIDLGQPGRLFNLWLHPSPSSLLFWDTIVLTGYLLLNIVAGWTTLDAEHKKEPVLGWVRPLIIISIPWAISIHTVTAFIYSGIVARPFWLTALLAPRFLASAFASGPALLIIISLLIKRLIGFDVGKLALQKLARIATYAMLINVFFLLAEFFTAFYSGMPEHVKPFQYLLFGLDGKAALVPWTWSSLVLAVVALVLLINPNTRQKESTLAAACLAVFVSIWIDKGLGLIVPGFIPSASGEVFEYLPSVPEVLITLGVWALGALVLTVLYRVAISVKEEAAD